MKDTNKFPIRVAQHVSRLCCECESTWNVEIQINGKWFATTVATCHNSKDARRALDAFAAEFPNTEPVTEEALIVGPCIEIGGYEAHDNHGEDCERWSRKFNSYCEARA